MVRGGQDTGNYYDIGAYEFNYSSTTAVEKSLTEKNYTVVQTKSSINIQNNGGSRLSIILPFGWEEDIFRICKLILEC